ncbi:MAG TPA: glycosyltransferase family 4 protein [Ignavibacteriaceae bacterium]|nr:MAG: GDP-mannose-dependent alpha-(1-6)-phosphatidylinositol monomannoside mannosyltransferase [Ignavibacteria bacterium ADurb.Bin266]OQY74754.1 MAG: glycosyl transferase family 1 [Ignavibacteriales bacterium UTCHB2]HQF41477.1 glycosyltransferase family 4 protein [Ignavibacteriaceae bacterium]HQI40472.1 glycosyltransferase family 4 protein [Ignavibacteriaceae bacterium]
MKIAIVHEWLVNYAGSEKVVESFTNIWPEADVFTLVDFLTDKERKIILKGKKAKTSFIQHLPFSKKKHRKYLPLFPKAIESFDLSKYDLIISSSHSVAKGVKTRKNQLHICYCHSPMRYAWDEADYYLSKANLNRGIRGFLAKATINYLRKWDLRSADNVNYFIANSNYIAKKIKRIYNRDADVIYPPVDVNKFSLQTQKEDFYLTASRLVPYKRIDLIMDAFARMPDKKLIVIGGGPEREKLKAKTTANISLIGYQKFESLREHMQKAKAFVFAAEEDFGIIVVEAMACGTPVIAGNFGGTIETVIDKKTGILFPEQTVDSIVEAVKNFETMKKSINYSEVRAHSEKFSREIFERNIKNYVDEKI